MSFMMYFVQLVASSILALNLITSVQVTTKLVLVRLLTATNIESGNTTDDGGVSRYLHIYSLILTCLKYPKLLNLEEKKNQNFVSLNNLL